MSEIYSHKHVLSFIEANLQRKQILIYWKRPDVVSSMV